MSNTTCTLMPNQRSEFAGAGVRRHTQWVAGTVSLFGARSSQCVQVVDPGGGPGI